MLINEDSFIERKREADEEEDYDDRNDYLEVGEESKQKRRVISKGSAPAQRVIAHVDLDCFYVQVERYHNPDLKDKPVAVVQYNPFGDLKSYAPSDYRLKDNGSIIAVSYEARARGVKRIMRGGEAKKVCPEILLVQVPTAHGKADLQIYREASSKILKVLGSRYSSILIERASIDEVYLDLTNEAIKLLQQEDDAERLLAQYIPILRSAPTLIAGEDLDEIKFSKAKIRDGHSGTALNNYLADSSSNPMAPPVDRNLDEPSDVERENDWFSRSFNEWTTEDRLLIAGAVIIQQLRKDVFEQLGFTCSAGIAENKMLSKLASSMHKPNKQTIVPKTVIQQLMINLPYSRVQGFGGKLGEDITKAFQNHSPPISTMGDLLKLPKQQLIQCFGEDTTHFILTRAKGIDDDPVQDRALPLQIGCSKSFRARNILLSSHFIDGTVLYWLKELAEELTHRMTVDTETNNRRAKQLQIGFYFKVVEHKNKSGASVKDDENEERSRYFNGRKSTTGASSLTENRVANWFEEQGISLSKVVRMPTLVTAESIAQLALTVIQKALNENPRIQQVMRGVLQYNQENSTKIGGGMKEWGITSLGLSACQLEELPTGKNAITSFFVKKPAPLLNDNGVTQVEPLFDLSSCENITQAAFIDVDESLSDIITESEVEVVQPQSLKRKRGSQVIESLVKATKYEESEEDSSQYKKLKAFHDKYMRGSSNNIDFETFLSFPQDIQQEIMNQTLFERNFQQGSTGKVAINNKSQAKKHSSSHHDSKTKPLNGWFQAVKK